jgi:hypothetical protein
MADVPAGSYDAQVWQPQLLPGTPAPSERLTLSGDTTTWSAKLKLISPPPMSHMHMGHY